MILRQIYEEGLSQMSYFLGCPSTGEALVVDPKRDVDTYLELAESLGLRIVAVAETHIHADYLSGARELAAQTGATLYLSDEGDENWKYKGLEGFKYVLVKDSDEFRVGNIRMKVLHTPGHTPEHITFLVSDGAVTEEPLLPLYDEELSRGRFMRGAWFYLALFLNPKGQVLARIPKMHLTPEERFLKGSGFGPHLVQTERGRLGVLICLDAFFQSHVERLDAQGAELLLVPSANPAPWDRPWPKDPARKEGEVWVEAMANRLLGRENLRLLLNPMLNGRFLGLVLEGQSGIYAQGQPPKLAGSPRGDDFLKVFWE